MLDCYSYLTTEKGDKVEDQYVPLPEPETDEEKLENGRWN